jgi:hypothetical protein
MALTTGGSRNVISLSLSNPSEMFDVVPSDPLAEDRLFESGVDHCLSVLRSHPLRGPVRLEVTLPPLSIDPETPEQLARTLHRYCDQRMAANRRSVQATRLEGFQTLFIGIPLVVAGLLIVFLASQLVEEHGNPNLVLQTIGGVLAWVGLWFPLDTMVFTPQGLLRENRALRRLRSAELTVRSSPA